MPKSLQSPNVPKIEIDQRSRDARLRLEQIEGLLVSWAPPTPSWLSRGLHRLCSGMGPQVTECPSAPKPRPAVHETEQRPTQPFQMTCGSQT
jgi:hypothetical protein